ncbi:MAG: hypothetical protein VCC99_03340 [Alphaproteobacteria bacterium]
MTLCTWIQEFQTLIVGIFGFVGVMVALWFNAWQAREQRREERRDERQTLRAALLEELKINREALVHNTGIVKEYVNDPSGTGSYMVPIDIMDDGYKAFTDRIGLLSQGEARNIMYAYLSLRTYNANLFLIGKRPNISDLHIEVMAEDGPKLIVMQEKLIGPIDEAIEVMERARDAD